MGREREGTGEEKRPRVIGRTPFCLVEQHNYLSIRVRLTMEYACTVYVCLFGAVRQTASRDIKAVRCFVRARRYCSIISHAIYIYHRPRCLFDKSVIFTFAQNMNPLLWQVDSELCLAGFASKKAEPSLPSPSHPCKGADNRQQDNNSISQQTSSREPRRGKKNKIHLMLYAV